MDMSDSRPRNPLRFLCIFVFCMIAAHPAVASGQRIDSSAVIRGIDASVAARDQYVLAYTVTESYRVYRNQDKDHPAAEMTVKTRYEQGIGKTYTVLSESGSELLRREVLERILENEQTMNQPANRSRELITSANYNMTVQGNEAIQGRNCIEVSIVPRQTAPYLFTGKIWVDAQDQSIAQLEGVASKGASILTGPAHLSRMYAKVDGFPMATRATATTSSFLLGLTTIQIEYTGYQVTLRGSLEGSRATTAGLRSSDE